MKLPYFAQIVFVFSPILAEAGIADFLGVRFGIGVSKPYAAQEYSDKGLGTGFHRDVPTMPTLLANADLSLRFNAWEAGIRFGLDGEILSVDRTDGTGFSVVHVSPGAGYRLFQSYSSSLWFHGRVGWAWPALRHDEAEMSEASGGAYYSACLGFVRQNVRVEIGPSHTTAAFLSRNGNGSGESEWDITHWGLRILWDWMPPHAGHGDG